MNLVIRSLALSAALALGACGGGGDDKPEADGPSMSMTVSPLTVSRSATTADPSPFASLSIRLADVEDVDLFIALSHSNSAVNSVNVYATSDTEGAMDVYFKSPSGLGAGTYNDVVTFSLCYDEMCLRKVAGSPAVINTTLTVTTAPGSGGSGPPPPPPGPQPEAGVTPLSLVWQNALPHDVIDAEYNNAMDAVIMVSSYPQNALYVHDISTGTETKVPLNKTPSSVSVAPDGQSVAVGHDALITVIDLTTLNDPLGAHKQLLNVTTDVLDVVLGGNGYVYAFPRHDQWEEIHTVHIATNVEQLGSGFIYAGTVGKLHPSGTRMYGADNGLSPSDIERYNITSGKAVYVYDSPYHGDYAMCGDLWMHETGLQIYTACGNVFRASDVRAQDMTYAGRLPLSTGSHYGFSIVSLSQSAEAREVALIEEDSFECSLSGSTDDCYSRVALHESDFLGRTALYSMAPKTVSGKDYAQRGLFIFHNAAGTQRFVISRLVGMPNPDAEYYLGRL